MTLKEMLDHEVATAQAVAFTCPDCAPGESHAAGPCRCGSDDLVKGFQGGRRTYFRCRSCGADFAVRHQDDHLPL